MEEVIFLVEDDVEGCFTAKGVGVSIYTLAASIEDLKIALGDSVRCHFEDDNSRINLFL